MSTAKMPHAILKPKEERRLLRGHLWAYRNEFAYLPEATDGALVDVFAEKRRFIGRGFFQAEGGIAIRLLSQHQETIDRAFFEERLKTALNLREQQFPHSTIYRWLYGESDLLPGLVVDRYDSVVVMQSACAFYEQHLELVSKTIKQLSNATNILWKCNDSQRWLDEPVHEIDWSNT